MSWDRRQNRGRPFLTAEELTTVATNELSIFPSAKEQDSRRQLKRRAGFPRTNEPMGRYHPRLGRH